MEAGFFEYLSGVHSDLVNNGYRYRISLDKLSIIYTGWTVFVSCFLVYFFSLILSKFGIPDDFLGEKRGTICSLLRRRGRDPLVIGAFYLSLIPVFGTIYASLPENSIYSSTRMLGDNFYQDHYNYREAVANSINENITENVRKKLSDRGLPAYISIQGIRIFNDDYIEADYVIDASLAESGEQRGLTAKFYLWRVGLHESVPVDVHGLRTVQAYVGDIQCSIENCREIFDIIKFGNPGIRLQKSIYVDAPTSSSQPVQMKMTKEDYRSYVDLSNALGGNALGNYGRLSRALYLSTAVVTTLGFGDIVPVSDQARYWVMIQSILGIVVAGMFLNSLAAKSDNGR